ncbi:MAG: sulfur oxidation protein SoxZ [Osedax symbiont Rs2]|nr:MAG: sulfur oxidation protein SoxZ [Osedax symbiont Rs2]
MKLKVKAKASGGVVKVKMLIKHQMETGRRKDKKGALIPAHHLTEITAEYQGNKVFSTEVGPGVSKDPFLAFYFKGAAGESLKISAIDTAGETGAVDVTIK